MSSPRIEALISEPHATLSATEALEVLKPKINFPDQSFELSPVNFCQSCENHHSRLTSVFVPSVWNLLWWFFLPMTLCSATKIWQALRRCVRNCFLGSLPGFKLRWQTSWKATSKAIAGCCMNQASSFHFWMLWFQFFIFSRSHFQIWPPSCKNNVRKLCKRVAYDIVPTL